MNVDYHDYDLRTEQGGADLKAGLNYASDLVEWRVIL